MREELNKGEAVGISARLLPVYAEGEQVLNGLVATTRAALDGFVHYMPLVLDGWYEAFRAVSS